jgi:hypothetical protein
MSEVPLYLSFPFSTSSFVVESFTFNLSGGGVGGIKF